jgi:hypothetical protein
VKAGEKLKSFGYSSSTSGAISENLEENNPSSISISLEMGALISLAKWRKAGK